MGAMSLGDALEQLLKSSGWKLRMQEIRLRKDWETIVGKTIAKYTAHLTLKNGVLTLSTTVAPLKQELQYGKAQLIQNINEFYKERVVSEIIIR